MRCIQTMPPGEHIHQKEREDKNKETDVKCEITFRIICDGKIFSQVKSKLYPPRKQAFLFICHHMA